MKINLFSPGDCSDIDSWSALPYYLSRGLLERSIELRPFDFAATTGPGHAAFRAFRHLRARAIRIVQPTYEDDWIHGATSFGFVNRRIQSNVRQYTDVDLNLFLTFTFSSHGYAGVPVVHYGDRTYEHLLEDTGRLQTVQDREFVAIDRRNIEAADLVLSTNDTCNDFIKSRYRPKRAYCLKGGTNSDVEVPDPEPLIRQKEHSRNILFVGRLAYRRGVDILIPAFQLFNERHSGAFTLHIVGVSRDELPPEMRGPDPSVVFHGYLSRNVPAEAERYNGLLRTARLFVMPMRPGPFPGVIREAQLLCTPVIASNVDGVAELMNHRDALLVDSFEPAAFAEAMDGLILDTSRWRRLAQGAHERRKSFTWTDTVTEFLGILRETGIVPASRTVAPPSCAPETPSDAVASALGRCRASSVSGGDLRAG